ncbi:hypothetical protein [Phenylobacterium sp.]|jgi:hypothetical protein|uniref:hypothetical protein n=1 Tax=Phenylobacterium sp. TaxID=1871053 RepID=UPI002F947BF3
MRCVAVALGLSLLAMPALAADPPAKPLTPAEKAAADKLRPASSGMDSFVGERRGGKNAAGGKREWESTRDQIDGALQQGDCDGARKIATNEGLHDLAAQIKRACRKR